MKTSNFFRIALVAASLTFMFACKKDNSSSSSTPSTTNLQTSSDDQAMASNENEAVSNDATAALTVSPSISGASINETGKPGGSVLGGGDSAGICDATIAFDTTSSTKTVTITYNGTNCWGNRTRTGTVVISVPKGVHWADKGATVSISIENLKITRVRDGKSIVINGTKTITNKSGGLLINLATLPSITYDLSDTLSIAFDNGSLRTWNASKERVFTYSNGIVITTTGTHSDGTNSDIAEWGTNRFGVSYSSRITAPKVIEQSCDFRLVSGQNTITSGDKFTAVITYGLDANGIPVTSCPTGNFYANVAWTYLPTGKTGSFLVQY